MKKLIFIVIMFSVLIFGLSNVASGATSNLNYLRAYWKLNELADGGFHNATDSSVNKQNGTNYGEANFTIGKLNNAANLSSSNTKYFDFGGDAKYGLSGNWTVATWIKQVKSLVGGGTDVYILSRTDSPAADGDWHLHLRGTGYPRMLLDDVGGGGNCFVYDDTLNLADGDWHRIIVTRNTTTETDSLKMFVDGAEVGHGNCSVDWGFSRAGATGRIGKVTYSTAAEEIIEYVDDVQIWNKTWSSDTVTFDWNGGQGIEADRTVTLLSPTNATETLLSEINLTSQITINPEILNLTTYVWNSNGNLFNKSTSSSTGTTAFTNATILNLIYDKYDWNVYVCNIDNCFWADSNRTFSYYSYKIISEEYNTNTTEGATEVFDIEIESVDGLQISSAYLNYNNTRYLGSFTNNNNNNFTITRSLNIEQINADVTVDFFWDIRMSDGSSRNSTTHQQGISNLAIDDCTTYSTLMMNLSLKDEELQTFLNATHYNMTVGVDIDLYPLGLRGSPIIEFSQNYSNIDNPKVCIKADVLNNSEYEMDASIKYDGDLYSSEYYNIQNYSLTNATIPQHIDLLDLKDEDATAFLITFKNSNFLPVTGALIQITRQYISSGLFKTVEIPKTDTSGQTVGHLVKNDEVYTIYVTKNGVTLATFTNVVAVCEDELTGNCKVNLYQTSTSDTPEDLETYGNLDYTMTFNEVLRRITVRFTKTDGSVSTVSLNSTKYDRFGNSTVCFDSLTSSSGTLTCNVPESFGNVTIVSKLYSDGELITTRVYTVDEDASSVLGGSRGVFMLALIITIPLMFISSAIGVILGSIIGMILASILLFGSGGSLIGEISAIVWFIIAGIIIIWKISQRER